VRHRAVAKQAAGGATDPGLALLESATLWLDAAQEPQTGTMPQWALNRGTGAVGHARIGSAGKAELRGSAGLICTSQTGNTATASWTDSSLAEMDVRVRVSFNDWTPSSATTIFSRGGGVGDRYFSIALNTDGTITTNFCNTPSQTTAALTVSDGQFIWLRATWEIGTVRVYQAADSDVMPTSWTQVGTDIAGSSIVQTGTTSLTTVGGSNNAVVFAIKRAWVSTAIGGSSDVDADFTAATPFATSFTESSSNAATVTINSTTGVDTNDPLLLTHDGSTNYLYLPGILSNYASTPDSAALDLTGDIELVCRFAPTDETPSAVQRLISKRPDASSANYEMYLDTTGKIGFNIGAASVAVSTSADTHGDGVPRWWKITYTGASTKVANFYVADDSPTEPSSWTQLGGANVAYGVTPAANTSPLYIGAIGTSFNPFQGAIYRAIVRNGIGGTTVFDADFTTNTNQSSFTESSSNAATVTINRATSGRKSAMVTRPVWLFGTDDYMEIADNDLLDFAASGDMTVLAVCRRWTNAPNNGRIVSKRDGSGTNVGWELLNDSTTLDVMALVDVGASNSTFPTNVEQTMTEGQLHSVGAIFDRTNSLVKAANGISISSGVSMPAGDASNAKSMLVGRIDGLSAAYNDMEVVAVAVFRSALTSTELGQIADYYGV
jgi:hypothetical protein